MAISSSARFHSLSWLIRLRWGLLLGELSILALAVFVLHIHLPLLPMTLALGTQALSNVFLYIQERRGVILQDWATCAVFLLDQLVLTTLLYCSGGHTNPFASMYLLQVVFAAFLLQAKSTLLLLGAALISYGALFFWNIPLSQLASHHHDGGETFNLHLNGMFLAFALLAILLAYFTYRLKELLHKQTREIGRLEQKDRDAQKLLALTTLAAGAAHELATPLASMSVAAHEMQQVVLHASPELHKQLGEDIGLIAQEVQRCQKILAGMSAQAGEHVGEEKQEFHVSEFFEDLKARVPQGFASSLEFRIEERAEHLSSRPPLPLFTYREALLTSLASFIKNAGDAGAKQVVCAYEASRHLHIFRISDDGTGMSDDAVKRVGEPFFTTKETGSGMGLGVYLAKSFAARCGGEVFYESQEGRGTQVTLTLHREEVREEKEGYAHAA